MFRSSLSVFVVAAIAIHCGGSSFVGTGGDGGGADGCTKDTDCKGERVCREGVCIDIGPSSDAAVGDTGVKKDGGKSEGGGVDADVDPLTGCTAVDIATERNPVILEIVLDGSGSMDTDNKWTAAKGALDGFFDELAVSAADDLAVGLLVYEDDKDATNGSGPYPSAVDVYPTPVTSSHHTALKTRMATVPSGGTPTFLAVSGAHKLLFNYVPPAGSALVGARRAAILISDGVPNGGSAEQTQVITSAKNAFALSPPAGPILTFAVGVGSFPAGTFSYEPKFMGDVAVAVGTRAFPQCNPAATTVANVCHIQITPGGVPVAQLTQEFLKAVRRARSSIGGCELKVLAPSASYDPSRAKLTMKDGKGVSTVVTRGGNDGWEFDDPSDPTRVTFSGASCAELGAAAEIKLEACEP